MKSLGRNLRGTPQGRSAQVVATILTVQKIKVSSGTFARSLLVSVCITSSAVNSFIASLP